MFTTDIDELHKQEKRFKKLKKNKLKQKQEQKNVKLKILKIKLNESKTIQKRNERDMTKL